MTPLEELKGIDMQVDVLLLAAQFVPFVPQIAENIQRWVTQNLNLSIQNLETYSKTLSQ